MSPSVVFAPWCLTVPAALAAPINLGRIFCGRCGFLAIASCHFYPENQLRLVPAYAALAQVKPWARREGVVGPRRFALVGGLCGTVVLAGWVAVSLAGLGSLGIENTGASIEDRGATSVTARAKHADAPPATAIDDDGVAVADMECGGATLAEPRPVVPAAPPPVLLASASTTDPTEDRRAASVTSGADHVDAPPASAMCEDGVTVADMESGGAALPDSASDASDRHAARAARIPEHRRSGAKRD